MQKKLNLVLLALKMVFLGYMIDGLNYLVWKSAMNPKRKNYRLLSFTDCLLQEFRGEFERIETLYLMLYDVKELRLTTDN